VTLRDESRKAGVCRADLRANMRRVLKIPPLRGIDITSGRTIDHGQYVRGGIGTLMGGCLPAIQLRSRRVF
jgi:hypothetical protein